MFGTISLAFTVFPIAETIAPVLSSIASSRIADTFGTWHCHMISAGHVPRVKSVICADIWKFNKNMKMLLDHFPAYPGFYYLTTWCRRWGATQTDGCSTSCDYEDYRPHLGRFIRTDSWVTLQVWFMGLQLHLCCTSVLKFAFSEQMVMKSYKLRIVWSWILRNKFNTQVFKNSRSRISLLASGSAVIPLISTFSGGNRRVDEQMKASVILTVALFAAIISDSRSIEMPMRWVMWGTRWH